LVELQSSVRFPQKTVKSRDTLRLLLGAIEIHCNRAAYVSLNTNANPNPNPNPKLSPNPTLTLTLCERNALLWHPVNYNLAQITRSTRKDYRIGPPP